MAPAAARTARPLAQPMPTHPVDILSRLRARPLQPIAEPDFTNSLSPEERRYLAVKRGLDVVVSALAIVCTLPIMLLAALAVKITSPGPLFFKQRRMGRNQRAFHMYKFRTMYAGADDDKDLFRPFNRHGAGPCFKMVGDPRITRVGRLLRRTSIDELPQLFNVLKGEMALVGPRPLPLDEVDVRIPTQRLRHTVSPGITCLWQVSGRAELPYDEWIALDLWYVRHRTLRLDLAILLRTIPAVLSGRGAY